MSENFKKVVNLQSKANGFAEQSDFARRAPLSQAPSPVQPQKKTKSKAEEIDKVYAAENTSGEKKDFGKIDRPAAVSSGEKIYKSISIILIVVMLAGGAFYFLKKNVFTAKKKDDTSQVVKTGKWYSVKLTSGDIYYGYIKDTSADPIVLEKVYYDYDQINKTAENKEENKSGNIRLVKRGKEAHGPDGTMDVVRAQALYLEPLGDDSKILKAILEYEKQ